MATKKTTKKATKKTVTKAVERSEEYKRFEQLIAAYKAEKPEKYEQKKEQLQAKLETL